MMMSSRSKRAAFVQISVFTSFNVKWGAGCGRALTGRNGEKKIRGRRSGGVVQARVGVLVSDRKASTVCAVKCRPISSALQMSCPPAQFPRPYAAPAVPGKLIRQIVIETLKCILFFACDLAHFAN